MLQLCLDPSWGLCPSLSRFLLVEELINPVIIASDGISCQLNLLQSSDQAAISHEWRKRDLIQGRWSRAGLQLTSPLVR